jgi:DNA-binding NarL/FixJ family response regulator
VLKSAPPAELLAALRRVAGGGDYVDPGLAEILRSCARPSRLSQLSPREREILALLAQGLNGEQVAERLVISSETVRTHVRNSMAKLGARTRIHAVALALAERAA